MITTEYLRARLHYNEKSGIFIWKIREVCKPTDKTWNKKFAGKETGYLRHNGYKVINLMGKEYSSSRLAWLYVHGVMPKKEIDHINGDRSDNRIENLREASRSENAINRGVQSNNTSGAKGVWKRKGMNSWVAEIGVRGKRVKLGSFRTREAAKNAYLLAAKSLHGEFEKK